MSTIQSKDARGWKAGDEAITNENEHVTLLAWESVTIPPYDRIWTVRLSRAVAQSDHIPFRVREENLTPAQPQPCVICHEPVDCDDPDVHSELIRLRVVIAEIEARVDKVCNVPGCDFVSHNFANDIRAIIERERK